MGLPYKKRFSLTQTGDTIVEVMIAAAIVSLVITGAYSTANKSLQQIRASQERTEANKVASAAMERLNTAVKNNNTLITTGSLNAFCVLTNGTVQTATNPGSNNINVAIAQASRPDCVTNGYRTLILREGVPGTRRFSVYVIWDGASGNQQRVVYSYYASST